MNLNVTTDDAHPLGGLPLRRKRHVSKYRQPKEFLTARFLGLF